MLGKGGISIYKHLYIYFLFQGMTGSFMACRHCCISIKWSTFWSEWCSFFWCQLSLGKESWLLEVKEELGNGSDEEGALTGECKKQGPLSEHSEPRQQIRKHSITRSLCKRNMIIQSHWRKKVIDHLLDKSFVPVVGVDQTSFMVALYDSEYDYLLLTPKFEKNMDHSTWQLSL